MKLEQKFYTLQDVTLHVVSAGDKNGETILFLHGFPEFNYGWHKQLSFFAGEGYLVVAPDQRGYNRSSKPFGVKAYTLEKLTADIIELIQQIGKENLVLVGHDWGGVVAWTIAMHHPNLLRKLIILNIPHPGILLRNLRKNPRQMLRSWYVAFFQVPVLPEKALQVLDCKLLARAMTGTAKRNAFSEADLATYKAAWRQPGALTGMINWYRAFKHTRLNLHQKVEVPTLMIWGKKDTALGAEMAEPSMAKCTNGKLIFLKEATHWLHHEQPERVNQEILTFIRSV